MMMLFFKEEEEEEEEEANDCHSIAFLRSRSIPFIIIVREEEAGRSRRRCAMDCSWRRRGWSLKKVRR